MEIDERLYQITKAVSALLFICLVALCILQVLCRYVLHISLSFTEELARYLFVWVTFLGSALAVKKRKHVNMDLLVNALPAGIRRGIQLMIRLFLIAVYIMLVWSGVNAVTITMDELSPALRMPMGFVYLAVPVSMSLMALFEIFDWKRGGAKS